MSSETPEKVYTSIVAIDESSKAGTPTLNDIGHSISKRGTTIATSDGGTLHVQPFRRTGSKQLRAVVTFVPRSSHFDSQEAGADQFRGFYSLFWIFCTLLSVKTIVYHHEETGSPLSLQFASLISKDLFTLFLSEGVLTFASLWAVLLVKAFKHGYIRYYWTGVMIQHFYQTAMLALAITWTFNRQWPWVQSGYFTLRCLVLIMKMHSYMAVNGYLQEVDVKASAIERKLRGRTEEVGGWDQAMSDARTRREELDQLDTTPSETPALIKSSSYFSPPAATALRNRLQNLELPPSLKRDFSGNSIQSEASSLPPAPTLPPPPAIPAPHPLVDHPDKKIAALAHDLSELELELTSTGKNKTRWPANLTWWNYFDYQFLPTLVYELEYPRTERIRPMYLLEKTIATFGTFFLLYQYTEHYIMPHVPDASRGQSFARSLLDLALPFMVCYLILFYLIFECICNGFAELSRFADRQFYEDWWNSTSWDQFARKWNKPVHTFLLKHVYASTLSYKSVGKMHAAFLTFLLSACVHELVMAVVTHKIRPYLFVLQMSQIPLIALGRVPFIKRNKVLGNVVFWVGLLAGFPLFDLHYLFLELYAEPDLVSPHNDTWPQSMSKRGATTLGKEETKPPPANALLLVFPKSDGDASIRPSPIGPAKDASGRWNYFRLVPLDEKTSTEWRRKIGSKVAEMMNKPNADKYYLADWPSGYAFFDHNKARDAGDMRHDPYLYGSRHCSKFRSTNEFIPHAYWLMTTSTLDNSECACKYCAKKKGQTEVNEVVLGVAPKTTNTRSTATKTSGQDKQLPKRRGKGKAPELHDSDATLTPSPPSRPLRNTHKTKNNWQRPPLNINHVPPWGYTARKRFQELHTGRSVRDGELIWFRLATPIYYSGNSGIVIDCWPAFAEDIEHRKLVTRNADTTSFTVQESVYVVTRPLMGGNTVVKVLESSVIPFRAWEISGALVDLIKQMALSSDLGMTSQNAVFDPRGCNGELVPGANFRDAAPYFAMAVQTAAHMDLYWAPMFQIVGGSSRSVTYQGLWLGAERIWLDDVIRIVPSHEQIRAHLQLRTQLLGPLEGSETRPLFMRINEISVDDVLTLHGPRKVCRVSGPLFCTVADPSYKLNPNGSSVLPPPEGNAIPGVKNATHFPLPIPPLGYRYVSLTADDQEVVLDAGMIAGRYYPRLFLSTSLDMPWMQVNRPSWWLSIAAMSGLAGSQYSRCNARFLMRERREAAEISEEAARADLIQITTPAQ